MEGTFIGMGPNPDGPDLPLGLGMRLAQEPAALDAFARLDKAGKSAIIAKIQAAKTGDEARRLIESVVESLSRGSGAF